MLDVLCAGEALWDLFAPAGVPLARAAALELRPGGGAINVALELTRMGHRAGAAITAGDDAVGHALRARLAARRIDTALVTLARERSGLMFVERTAAGRRLVGYRSEEPALPVPEGFAARILLLSGVTPWKRRAASFRAAARAARRRGIPVVVDLNARPRIWAGEDPASIGPLVRLADVIKASAFDLATLRLDAAALRDVAPRAVMVTTSGAGPARATGRFGEVERVPPPSAAREPLGAGDAFVAGLLAEMLKGGPLTDGAVWDRALLRGHARARAHLRRLR